MTLYFLSQTFQPPHIFRPIMSLVLTMFDTSHKNNIIYGPDGSIWYWIETGSEHFVHANPTNIYHASPNGKQLVATMTWHAFHDDTIKYESEESTRLMKDMFRHKGVFNQ